MGIAEDLLIYESRLTELITKYEQYFIGLEKREPIKLLEEMDKFVRRYSTSPINNTMYKYRFNNLVARFSSYRQQWTRIVREIEEGRYSRDKFKAKLHDSNKTTASKAHANKKSDHELELDRVYNELIEARKRCHLPTAGVSREQLAATLDTQRPVLAKKLGTSEIQFRVVVEEGKPKIKAGHKRHDEPA